jgi:signal peptidase I
VRGTDLVELWSRYRRHALVDLVVTLASAVVIAFVVQLWVVKPYRIPSESMVPTLKVTDRIIVARFIYHLRKPERGEILVFHPNGRGDDVFRAPTASTQNYVKRLIGLPNEILGASRGQVWVCSRGKAPANLDNPGATAGCRYLNEPYTHDQQTDTFGPVTLGRDEYFMMGDNRGSSEDSRFWGQIHERQIIGRAFMTYWPLSRISFF